MTSGPIRFNDIYASYTEQRETIDAAIADVLAKGDFINGRAVGNFEKAFAEWCGTPDAVGCSNGTSALHLCFAALGLGPEDEIIVPAMTFIATSEAVMHAGARLVFADVNIDTLNLDPAATEAAITPRTRAIVFVHLHGNPTGVKEIASLAARKNLLLIEDCAQAHGAWISSAPTATPTRVGCFGQAGAFSFFPAKNLGAFGDAGAVVSLNPETAALARRLANHGRSEKYVHLIEGYNYRIDSLQAAVLAAKLPSVDNQVDRRNRLAEIYRERLTDLPVEFQQQTPDTRHALHLFVIRTDRRDALQAALREQKIETGIHYPIALSGQPAYASLGHARGAFPNAESDAETTLSLPMYPQLSPDDVARVCDAITQFFGK
ncbi:erythromycin biosynthesis sensory transduction protein eryC1 [candidate division BRC1 bacterium HGW-BRC1-1]|jgi:dTDP-4-amino-4,6-dideoxygalactose transaminase|nr:MAG: erythromycin biosynthesis sensory transduction protein eryC1 [candidate division BRC1 bacterium HGW-BRC1-1]